MTMVVLLNNACMEKASFPVDSGEPFPFSMAGVASSVSQTGMARCLATHHV
jgi:hypothetical protein